MNLGTNLANQNAAWLTVIPSERLTPRIGIRIASVLGRTLTFVCHEVPLNLNDLNLSEVLTVTKLALTTTAPEYANLRTFIILTISP